MGRLMDCLEEGLYAEKAYRSKALEGNNLACTTSWRIALHFQVLSIRSCYLGTTCFAFKDRRLYEHRFFFEETRKHNLVLKAQNELLQRLRQTCFTNRSVTGRN